MIDKIFCSIQNHEAKPVVSLCLNPECILQAACCSICQKHHGHNIYEYQDIGELDQIKLINVNEQKSLLFEFQIYIQAKFKEYFSVLDEIDYLGNYMQNQTNEGLETIAKQLKFQQKSTDQMILIDQTENIKKMFQHMYEINDEIINMIKSQSFYHYEQIKKKKNKNINQSSLEQSSFGQQGQGNSNQYSQQIQRSINSSKNLYNKQQDYNNQYNSNQSQYIDELNSSQQGNQNSSQKQNIQYNTLFNSQSSIEQNGQQNISQQNIQQGNQQNNQSNIYQHNQYNQFQTLKSGLLTVGNNIINQSHEISPKYKYYLESGQIYQPGTSIRSKNHQFLMSFNENGSLKVCNQSMDVMFAQMPPNSRSPYLMKFTQEGAIFLEDGNNTPYFNASSINIRRGPYQLVLDDNNGELQIIDKHGTRQWTSRQKN